MSNPTFKVTNTTHAFDLTGELSISVTSNHSSATGTATIEGITTLNSDLGDKFTIDLGYEGTNTRVFTGYVKQWDFSESSQTYTLTLNDSMVRAVDYYIVSTDPDHPFTRNHIQVEDLIGDLFALCGLTNIYADQTYFHLQTSSPNGIEVNMVSVFDYSKQLADIVAWNLWADSNELIHFENRKPFVMTGAQPEFPGDKVDVSEATITDTTLLDLGYAKNESNLRNRVVVYGDGVTAEAKAVSPYLPTGFYKTVLIAFPMLITTQETADDCASYNLDKLNRLTEMLTIVVEGNPSLEARKVITMNSITYPTYSGLWYIYSCDQTFSTTGYITKLELRK
jgi:hypothetical protein